MAEMGRTSFIDNYLGCFLKHSRSAAGDGGSFPARGFGYSVNAAGIAVLCSS